MLKRLHLLLTILALLGGLSMNLFLTACTATGDDDDATPPGDDDDASDDDDMTPADDDDATPPPVEDIDCDAATDYTCGQIAQGTTVDAADNVTDWYACVGYGAGYLGGDAYFEFMPSVTESITISLSWADGDQDLDMFVLDACDVDATCLGESSSKDLGEEVAVDAVAGEAIFIAVDGWNGSASDFTLEITSNCDAGDDDDAADDDDSAGDDDDSATGDDDDDAADDDDSATGDDDDSATGDDDDSAAPSACETFCASAQATCVGGDQQWADAATCEAACGGWAPGTPGDTSGDTFACRDYHLGVAINPGPASDHCGHVGGAAPCN